MNFFYDNNISYKIVNAIKELVTSNHNVIHLTERFPADTADEIWMSKLKSEKFIIISGDPRIARRPHEKKALLDSNLTVFFLGKGWMTLNIWKQASGLIKIFPEILELAGQNPNSCIFEINKAGKFIQR